MEKRLFMAVVISVLVMLLYPFLLAKISPPPVEPHFSSQQPIDEKKEAIETPPTAAKYENTKAALPSNARSMSLINDRYKIDLLNIGGSIEHLEIKDDGKINIQLVNEAIYEAGMFSVEGKGALAGLSSQLFATKEDTNIFYIEKNNLRVEKDIILLNDKYGLYVSIKITNRSDSTEPLSFKITTASNISNKEMFESRYIEASACYKDGRIKRIAGGNAFNSYKALYAEDIEWVSLKNKYYSIIAKPDFNPSGVFTTGTKEAPILGFIIENERILPGETKQFNFICYIGPTEANELIKVDKSFEKALNFGIFTSIGLVLLSILKFFYGLFHNYGVSILLLTGCVSLALFPLTFKSMKSMRKLQEIQPHIEKVRLQHKDNPHKLNKEIMELYRRYNVNPMGGCFPMLLQMPIFIALYQTLMRSVELKGAGFLWIKDLSMPDAAFHIPFSIPFLGNTINLLPILMIGAMIIQQKMSQTTKAMAQTEQQKMMAFIMPVMFGFIFYNLPSGLVLYWVTNTILTSSLQFFLLRKA